MFKSFFPKPKWFFLSAILWSIVTTVLWYSFKVPLGALIGLDLSPSEPVIGIGFFFTDSFKLLYLYYLVAVALFAAFWFKVQPHRWQGWSILVSSFILFVTYFSVQVSVALNYWRRPFFDLIQTALDTSTEEVVALEQLYELLIAFAEIAFFAICIFVLTRFVVSHYIFRWRTAMNDYYTDQWEGVRHIEGASQRVQEDTMRFAAIMEGLGVALIDAVMTLIAFLPLLLELSEYVAELPLVGAVPYPLFTAALFWSVFGTGLLAAVGIKLPGLEFKNQRVEAAFRKELVYGEDDSGRAEPLALKELFGRVRKNYFRLYFHYMYFNIARSFYLQADNIFVFILLVPTIIAKSITYGILQQILTAFNQVSNSFQYLVNSWTTIVDLLSVYKRLASFEAAIKNEPLPTIDQQELASRSAEN